MNETPAPWLGLYSPKHSLQANEVKAIPILGTVLPGFCCCPSPRHSASSKSCPWDSSIMAHWDRLLDGARGTPGFALLPLARTQPLPTGRPATPQSFSPLLAMSLEPIQGALSSPLFLGFDLLSAKAEDSSAPTGQDRANMRSDKTSPAAFSVLASFLSPGLLRSPGSPERDSISNSLDIFRALISHPDLPDRFFWGLAFHDKNWLSQWRVDQSGPTGTTGITEYLGEKQFRVRNWLHS